MRSAALSAFLRGLVLPFGATSGTRIVLDGDAGTITVYNATDEIVFAFGAPFGSVLRLGTGDDDESGAEVGGIFASIFGAGAARQLQTQIASPRFSVAGRDQAFVTAQSESFDGTVNTRVNVGANILQVSATEGTNAELELESKTIGRGGLRQFTGTGNNGPHADLAVTDMVLNNVPVIAGHTYEFRVHTMAEITAVISQWILTFNVNGVVTDRFVKWRNPTAAAFDSMVEGTCYWVAPTTQATDDFAVGVDEQTATAATCLLAGSGTVRRTFTCTDLGVLAP
jgi:hypothetical protein